MEDKIQQVSLHLQNQVTSLQGDLDSFGNNSPGSKKKKKKAANKDEILDGTVSGSKSRSKNRKRKVVEIVEVDDEGDSDGNKLKGRPRMTSSSDEDSESQDEIDLSNYFTKPEVEKFVSEIYDRFKQDEENFKVV